MKIGNLLFLLLLPASLAAADPYIGYLYPAGAQTGTTVRVLVGGQNLQGIRDGIVPGGGVSIRSITAVPSFPAPDATQRKYLLEWLARIETGNRIAPERPEKTDSWRKNLWWEKLDQLDLLERTIVTRNLCVRRNALQATPSLRQMAIVEISVAADAEPGAREFRLWGRNGISAPKLFYVDRAPHTPEPLYVRPGRPKPPTPLVTRFPAVLDGQIMPGETDRFRLRLEAEKFYTMTLVGRKLQPFIGDAVPGHFQPVLRLLRPDGSEAAFADDEGFNPDPVLRFRPDADGDYLLEVRDNLYRGREDFVYRVTVEPREIPYRFGEEPFPELPRLEADRVAEQILDIGKPQLIAGTRCKHPVFFAGFIKGGGNLHLSSFTQETEGVKGRFRETIHIHQPVTSVKRGIMKIVFLINVRGVPIHAALATGAHLRHGLADKRRIVTLVVVECERPGRRVPLPENQRNPCAEPLIDLFAGCRAERS